MSASTSTFTFPFTFTFTFPFTFTFTFAFTFTRTSFDEVGGDAGEGDAEGEGVLVGVGRVGVPVAHVVEQLDVGAEEGLDERALGDLADVDLHVAGHRHRAVRVLAAAL